MKTYGREEHERRLFDAANREVVARDSKRMWASLARGITTAAITVVIMSVVTVFISGGNAWFGITPGTVILMFTYTNTVTNQFNFINTGLQRINQAFGDASGMTAVLDEPRLVADKPDAKPLDVEEGEIDFDDINFWYTDGDVKTQVFDDFNLHIPAGQRVGLVGISGAGKTTLTKLLLRLADIQEGEILVDDQNVADVTQQSLRRQIAYVPQEALLFHRTIAENIAYGRPDATMEEIREAARAANALEFIEALPQGFATITGERGIKLSGGQRQRVCIARALAMNPEIIIADESVSALDVSVRAQIINLLLALQKEFRIAFLFICHDMAVIERVCHRVAVMYLGQIVELGSRRDVFENPLHPYTKRLMSAVPIPDPSRRTMSHTLLTGEIPSPVRSADYEPVVAPLKEVSPGHFVSEEQVANWF